MAHSIIYEGLFSIPYTAVHEFICCGLLYTNIIAKRVASRSQPQQLRFSAVVRESEPDKTKIYTDAWTKIVN